jgi:hypothetical protein
MPNLFGCYNVRISDNHFIWDKDMKFLWRSLSFYSNDMQKKKDATYQDFSLLKYKYGNYNSLFHNIKKEPFYFNCFIKSTKSGLG